MTYEEQFSQLLYDTKPVTCEACGGKYEMIRQGTYKCNKCGDIVYDDFGKIKRFLEEHGPAPATVISQNTGVPVTKITELIREGRIETTKSFK